MSHVVNKVFEKPGEIEVTVNDLEKIGPFQLYNLWDGKALDLSASTTVITGLFRAKGNTTASLFAVTFSKLMSEQGVVSMVIPADGLDVDIGRYEMEITTTYDSRPQTARHIVPIRVVAEFPAVA